MKQSHLSPSISQSYLIRENIPQQTHRNRCDSNANNLIRMSALGIGSAVPNSSRPISASPSAFETEDYVKNSIREQQQYYRSNSSRHSEPHHERLTYDVGIESRPLPVCQSLRNCQSMRFSEPPHEYKPRPKMLHMSSQKLCRSYRTIHLAVLVPEDSTMSSSVDRLVEQASLNGLIVVNLGD